jgi:hypothetical protein
MKAFITVTVADIGETLLRRVTNFNFFSFRFKSKQMHQGLERDNRLIVALKQYFPVNGMNGST